MAAQDLGLGARGEDIVVGSARRREDGDDLGGVLPWQKTASGRAVAQGAVEVHAREAEVLHGQVAQPGERALGRERAPGDLFEERSYLFAIHRSASLALPLRKPWRSSVTKW